MKQFSDASYLGQVRRLRQLAEAAVLRYDIKSPAITFINHGENATFRVDGKGSKSFLLRVHRENYHTKEAIHEELGWLRRIRSIEGMFAPKPVKSKSGNYLETVSSPGIPDSRFCDLLEWVDGRFIYKSATPRHLFLLGQLIAKLHRSTKNVKVKHRHYWDANGLVGSSPKFGTIDKISGLDKAKQSVITEGRKEVLAYLRKFEKRFPDRLGLIHADLHFGNFLINKGELGAIDFDDCGFGFHAYDLAVPLTHIAYLCKDPQKEKFLRYVDEIQNGYASQGSWDHHDEKALPYFYTARKLTMVGWADSRSNNPRLKKRLLSRAKELSQYLKTDWKNFH